MTSTRRGFLRSTVAGTAALTSGCRPERLPTEGVASPASPQSGSESVRVPTTVNGTAHTLDVGPDTSALQAIREQLQLTGSKHGCGHGACGTCTMQLDGTPVVTCLLPATALANKRVTTVEGIAPGDTLHAVQSAFMAEDALQCGYCTPGFIVEAEAFVRNFRAQAGTGVGTGTPDREQIAEALSGHLCRCGAYEGIFRAVAAACAGHYDGPQPMAGRIMPPRVDAREKVTGQARYTVDVSLAGMLHAKALHSPYAHAVITKLDWSAAREIPGVRGVVDLMHGSRTIRYAGQEIVAIAAIDEDTAARAIAAVDVEYDVQPAMLTLEQARADNASLVYGKRRARKTAPNASEGPLLPEPWDGNVRGPLKIFSKRRGKAKRAIEDARNSTKLVEGTWTTAVQCHTTLEPHAAVAQWRGDSLTVYLSTQGVKVCAEDLAERLGLKRDQVEVIADYIGAGFGAKGGLGIEAVIAAELAQVCGAPVRYVLDRREELMLGGYRPGTQLQLQAATNDDGDLAGVQATSYSTSGVAVGHMVSPMLRILYPEAPKRLLDFDVLTHAPPGKPFRGPGGPQAYWALEQAVDELAHARGEDPLAMRKRWDPNPAREPLYAWASALDVWTNRAKPGADKGRYRRGVGLAFGAWFTFCDPKARVQLETGPDGIRVKTATQDMGNGTRTVLANTVAAELGMSPADIDVRIGTSKHVHGPLSSGSRTVSSLVPACVVACDALKAELFEAAEDQFNLQGAVATRTGVEHRGGVLPWAKLAERLAPISVIGKRPRDKRGWFLPPAAGLAVEAYVSSSIQIMEIEVDTRLGRTRAVEAWGGFGVGRLVSPQLARSQATGGVLQAVSYTLYEERRLDPKHGFLLTAGLEDYRIMGLGDAPKLNIHFHEQGYERVPQRSVGIGELVTLAPVPAIGNAMFHATGWRPKDLPLRPDRVLSGVRG